MASRKYPKYPIPSVGGVVVGRNGILLVRRDKEPGKGSWSVPGGAIELGEDQERALVREIREETGVLSKVIQLLGTADVVIRDSKGRVEYHYVINHYLVRALTDDTRPESAEAEVRWFKFENLPKTDMNPRVYQLLERNKEKIVLLAAGIESSK